mmetsp:Transcript_15756/g.37676  ORF Transcript_15756/g.37676 Transcript_15756/m.37676 type:complete len:274 (+) Transcript_15756:2250-3071(+)
MSTRCSGDYGSKLIPILLIDIDLILLDHGLKGLDVSVSGSTDEARDGTAHRLDVVRRGELKVERSVGMVLRIARGHDGLVVGSIPNEAELSVTISVGEDVAGFGIAEDVPGLGALMGASDEFGIHDLPAILLPTGLHSQAGTIVIINGVIIVGALVDLISSGRPTNKEEGINGAPAVFLPSHAHGILRILQEKGRRAALLGNAALVIGRRRGSQGRGHEEGSSEARRRATHHDLCFTIVVCDFFRERISSVSVQGKRALGYTYHSPGRTDTTL